jgi:hypothetical protein
MLSLEIKTVTSVIVTHVNQQETIRFQVCIFHG